MKAARGRWSIEAIAKRFALHAPLRARRNRGARARHSGHARRIPPGRIPAQVAQDAPRVAFKTGTSYGFRDAWAIGVSNGYAIGVWVGRPDGAPRPGATGRSEALPILFEAFDLIGAPCGAASPRLSRAETPPPALARLDSAREGLSILFPPDGRGSAGARLRRELARTFALGARRARSPRLVRRRRPRRERAHQRARHLATQRPGLLRRHRGRRGRASAHVRVRIRSSGS